MMCYQLGLAQLKTGDLQAAKMHFMQVLVDDPNHTGACFYLGLIYLAAHQLEQAESAFRHVVECKRDIVEAWVNLGVIALKKQQAQRAVEHFSQALVLDPTNHEARHNLAATFIQHDRYHQAITHYDTLLKSEPNNPEYLYNAGVAQMMLGQFETAEHHFKQAIAFQGDAHAACLQNLAAIYMQRGNKELSIHYLREVIKKNSNDKVCQFMLNGLTGNQRLTQHCPEYTCQLFDRYAFSYEKHMQTSLKYTLPHHLGHWLHRHIKEPLNRVLDLGCGTGLSGEVLRELCLQLNGVDLSVKMLAQAEQKAIYDQLHQSEMIAWMLQDELSYDLIIAMDVLPYVSDLHSFFQGVKPRLDKRGFLIVTTELMSTDDVRLEDSQLILQDKGWYLQDSLRFAHDSQYVIDCAARFGLQCREQLKLCARQQEDHDVWVVMSILH